ncbi:MAG: glycosyltransferase [Planctomycetes bacterium]|nr:glycosyltransferase [Planctomycetota bacterium]MCB9888568.1 glycosyltransferase [Planctomycetota bacterium]
MRILVVSPFQPHPHADHGGAFYLGQLVEALRDRVEVGLVHYRHQDDRSDLLNVRLWTTPRARRTERSFLRQRLDQLGFAVDWGVRGWPLEVAKLRTRAFVETLRRARDEFRPDVALVEFSVMAWCLPELRDTKTILTDHECGESVPRKIGPSARAVARDRALWRSYVGRFYPQADRCQALSRPDAEHLQRVTGRRVDVRPAMVGMPDEPLDPTQAGPVMVFFGDYSHHPNPEAAMVLAKEVLPRVRRSVPHAELWLAGARIPPVVQALASLPGVRVLGFVDDLRAMLAGARCVVAPMYSGSGVRMKVLVSYAYGVPVVANQLGMQGIEAPAAVLAGGETFDALAQAAVRFLADPAAAAAAGAAGRAFVFEAHSVLRIAERQIELCRSLSAGVAAT